MTSSRFLKLVLAVVAANFIVQIPYYIQQYYIASGKLPSLTGVILMLTVFAWFLVGFGGLIKRVAWGYWLLLSFFAVEFLFYIQTQIVQLMSGKGVLLHVVHFDGLILFIVFAVGYINCLAAAYFIWYMLRHRQPLISD